MRRLRDEGSYDDILKDILMTCDRCKSFILPIKTLYRVIENLSDYDLGFYEIREKIIGIVDLSLEEWTKYATQGLKDVDFVYANNGDLETDTEGNPYKYLWEECAVILDPKCVCNSVIRGY